MEAENQILTTQQSLDIITKMIRQAHVNVKRSSVYLILWGAVITLANLGMFGLMWAKYQRPYLVWLITIPAWILTIYISYRHGKNVSATSHFDRINAILWYIYGIIIFTLVVFGYKINYQLNPVILLISAIPVFVSGTIIKSSPENWRHFVLGLRHLVFHSRRTVAIFNWRDRRYFGSFDPRSDAQK